MIYVKVHRWPPEFCIGGHPFPLVDIFLLRRQQRNLTSLPSRTVTSSPIPTFLFETSSIRAKTYATLSSRILYTWRRPVRGKSVLPGPVPCRQRSRLLRFLLFSSGSLICLSLTPAVDSYICRKVHQIGSCPCLSIPPLSFLRFSFWPEKCLPSDLY